MVERTLRVAARCNWHLLWMLMTAIAIAGCKSSKETTGGKESSATEQRIPTTKIIQVFDDPELELEVSPMNAESKEYGGESSAFVPGNITIMNDSGWVKSIELYTKYPDASRKGSLSMKAITGVANAVDLAIAPWIKEQIQQHQAMQKVPVKQFNGEIEDELPTVKASKEFAAAKVTLILRQTLTLLIE